MNGQYKPSPVWSVSECSRFGEGMIKHGRVWSKVAAVVQTKTAVEVQAYFEQLLLELDKEMGLQFNCNLRLDDVVDQMIITLTFVTFLKRTNGVTSPSFFQDLKGEIILQKERISDMKRLTVRLYPATLPMQTRLQNLGHNPFIQLTLQPQRPVCDILKYLSQKFTQSLSRESNRAPGVFRLYPPVGRRGGERIDAGWGEETTLPIDGVLKYLNCPVPFYLEFDYLESSATFLPNTGHLPMPAFPNIKPDPGPAVAAILSNMSTSPEQAAHLASTNNNDIMHMDVSSPFSGMEGDSEHKEAEKRKRAQRKERRGTREEEASSLESEAQRQFKQARRDDSYFDSSRQTTMLMDSLFIDEAKRMSPLGLGHGVMQFDTVSDEFLDFS